VTWPAGELDEDPGATIIYGSHPSGEEFNVHVVAKVWKPLMQDNGGQYVTISSPRLGWTGDPPDPDYPLPQSLHIQSGESRKGDPASLGKHDWYEPERMRAPLTVDDLVGARQESGTPPPVGPFQTAWEAKDSLGGGRGLLSTRQGSREPASDLLGRRPRLSGGKYPRMGGRTLCWPQT
jgi:hypothetical protein